MKLNPRTLYYLETIAEEKSISKAAQRLNISQPSLSQHIINAEKAANVQFFNRNTSPITLSYAGKKYLEAGKELKVIETRLTREIEDIAEGKMGKITVGVYSTRSYALVPWLFAQFKKTYPKVELELVEDTNNGLLSLVQNNKVDIALVGHANDQVVANVLFAEPVKLAVPSRFSIVKYLKWKNVKKVDLSLFKEEPFILLHSGQAVRMTTDKIFSDYQIKPFIAYETKSYLTSLEMAKAGLGCTFITQKESISSDLEVFELDKGPYLYPIILVHKKDLYITQPMSHLIKLAKELQNHLI